MGGGQAKIMQVVLIMTPFRLSFFLTKDAAEVEAMSSKGAERFPRPLHTLSSYLSLPTIHP